MIASATPFQEHAHLLLRLHELIGSGKDESDEGERIRDGMDNSWFKLSHREKDVIRGLSADLYSLGQDRTLTDHEAPVAAFNEFDAALQGQDWYAALDILRNSEGRLPPAIVAVCRGGCWSHLGLPEVAIRFFEEARRLGDESPLLDVWLLNSSIECGQMENALSMAQNIEQNAAHPIKLLKAAWVLSIYADVAGGQQSESYRQRAVRLAERGLRLADAPLSDSVEKGVLDALRFDTHFNLACDYDALGDSARARTEAEKAIAIDPDDPKAIQLRALLAPDNLTTNRRATVRCQENKTQLSDASQLLDAYALRRSKNSSMVAK